MSLFSRQPVLSLHDTDKRLFNRFSLLLCKFIENPKESIPKSLKDWGTIKSAYRFFQNPRVSPEMLTVEAVEDTASRVRKAGGTLLIAHDTTCIDYSGLQSEGVGRNGIAKHTRGFLLHSSFAMTDDGVPLGILSQSIWTRHEVKRLGSKAPRLPMEEKESRKWLQSFRESVSSIPETTRSVSVCDREADIYEFLCSMYSEGHDYVIRSAYDRKLSDGMLMSDRLGGQPVLARYEYDVQRVHEAHPKRKAKMAVRACEIEIQRPDGTGKLAYARSLKLNVVWAQEETAGIGKDGKVSWTLLTSLPIDSVESIMRVLGIYKLRWKIERFHYVLKSGCNVEKKQLGTAHSLKNMLAFFSIVAYKLLWLKYEAQANPARSCEVVLSKTEWQALCCHSAKSAIPPASPPALAEAAVMIAKLGGFIGRKSDGFPGVKAIWDGIRSLNDIHSTFLIFMKNKVEFICG